MKEPREVLALHRCHNEEMLSHQCVDACDNCLKMVDREIEALARAGFAIVPVEPTELMLGWGEGYNIRCGCPQCDHDAHEKIKLGWQAMLRAATEADR